MAGREGSGCALVTAVAFAPTPASAGVGSAKRGIWSLYSSMVSPDHCQVTVRGSDHCQAPPSPTRGAKQLAQLLRENAPNELQRLVLGALPREGATMLALPWQTPEKAQPEELSASSSEHAPGATSCLEAPEVSRARERRRRSVLLATAIRVKALKAVKVEREAPKALRGRRRVVGKQFSAAYPLPVSPSQVSSSSEPLLVTTKSEVSKVSTPKRSPLKASAVTRSSPKPQGRRRVCSKQASAAYPPLSPLLAAIWTPAPAKRTKRTSQGSSCPPSSSAPARSVGLTGPLQEPETFKSPAEKHGVTQLDDTLDLIAQVDTALQQLGEAAPVPRAKRPKKRLG